MSRYFAANAREPVSSWTHFWGAVGGAAATVGMALYGAYSGAAWYLVLGAVLFGFSLIALYTASSVYHFVQKGPRAMLRLRKLDHSMIYVLIAGSYTPICLKFMQTGHAARFLAGIWGMAAAGILIKLCWMDAPRLLYTGLYLAMGWAIVLDIPALAVMPGGCLALVAAGGVLYSVGAVLYIAKRPNLPGGWGFHELFHLFILAGSACHIAAVFGFVL